MALDTEKLASQVELVCAFQNKQVNMAFMHRSNGKYIFVRDNSFIYWVWGVGMAKKYFSLLVCLKQNWKRWANN